MLILDGEIAIFYDCASVATTTYLSLIIIDRD